MRKLNKTKALLFLATASKSGNVRRGGLTLIDGFGLLVYRLLAPHKQCICALFNLCQNCGNSGSQKIVGIGRCKCG